jgi:hypothetical protein
MFIKCCCCRCIFDCFFLRPKRKIKSKVKKVEWDIIETKNYQVKIPVFHYDENYLEVKKKNRKARRP